MRKNGSQPDWTHREQSLYDDRKGGLDGADENAIRLSGTAELTDNYEV